MDDPLTTQCHKCHERLATVRAHPCKCYIFCEQCFDFQKCLKNLSLCWSCRGEVSTFTRDDQVAKITQTTSDNTESKDATASECTLAPDLLKSIALQLGVSEDTVLTLVEMGEDEAKGRAEFVPEEEDDESCEDEDEDDHGSESDEFEALKAELEDLVE